MNFFIHFLKFCFLKKCLHIAGFIQLGAPYANIRNDPTSEYNWLKSEYSEHQQSWFFMGWGGSETPTGVLGAVKHPEKIFTLSRASRLA